ncbi:unnamed protein product, partial [Amoebophrya sp. A25]
SHDSKTAKNGKKSSKKNSRKAGQLYATPCGKAIVASDLDLDTGLATHDMLHRAAHRIISSTELHLCYLITPYASVDKEKEKKRMLAFDATLKRLQSSPNPRKTQQPSSLKAPDATDTGTLQGHQGVSSNTTGATSSRKGDIRTGKSVNINTPGVPAMGAATPKQGTTTGLQMHQSAPVVFNQSRLTGAGPA